MNNILDDVRCQLRENADEKLRFSGQRFFKEAVFMYGIKTALVTTIAKQALARLKGSPKEEVFALCDDLWRSGYMEEGFIACAWAHSLHKQYTPEDFQTFERWVESCVTNWAFLRHPVQSQPRFVLHEGYGWMLKAASEAHPTGVFDYLMSHKDVMPRTAFRYALEKMPKEWRDKAMKKSPSPIPV